MKFLGSQGRRWVLWRRSLRGTGPLLVWALVFSLATVAFGQMNTAQITGIVSDPSGALVPGATVVALHVATQQKYSVSTNDVGQYLLGQLPPGEYTLSVDAPGFRETLREGVALHVNDQLRQDFRLELGEKTQTMIVVATPGQLETESVSIKDVVENQEVIDLPQKNRDFLDLTLLSEGVVNPPGGTRGDALQQTGKLINILGQRTGHNLFLIDGVSITDEYFNNAVLNPSPDATEEFIIDKTNYDAEFGGKSGGVINVITKSGTDDFHGSAYEFLRNDVVDAKNYFALPNQRTPPYKENQFGAATGGPIVRDKAFFFVNYDGQRLRQSLAHLFSVPTAAERAGNIGRTPLAGPFDPLAVALLNLVPLPNLAGTSNNLLAESEETFDTNQYNARIDDQLSPHDSLFLRASVFDAHEFDPYGSSVLNEALLPGFGRSLGTHTVNLALGETHTISPSVANEFRFGWLRVSGGQADPNRGNPFARTYGLSGTTTNPADLGYPQVSLSNTFTTIGAAAGFTSRINRDFELYDNVLIHKNTHSIQFGGYFFHLSFNPRFPNDARGVYTYSGLFTGTPLGDFLEGDPSQAQAGIGEGAENAHTNWAHFYVQDGWQLRPSLRLNLGLRYEYNQNLVARANETSDIDLSRPGGPVFVFAGDPAGFPASASALLALSPIPVVSASTVGSNSSLLTRRPLRFSPRLGLAWQIPDSSGTVVRAGFGIYTNQASYSILQNLAENIPFFLVKTVTQTATKSPCIPSACTTETILAENPTGTIGANSVDPNFRVEYNEVWNLALEKAISANTTVEAEYIGSRTVHADSATAVNVPEPAPGAVQPRRPYPNLAAFTTIRWNGWATFNGLSLKLTRRFSRALSFETTYTWSKSIDDASDAGTTNAEYNLPQNVYDLNLEKARSSFDHTNRLTANAVYDLPLRKGSTGWLGRTLGGWRASGLLTAQSGSPFTVNLSSAADVANIGLVGGNNLERPNVALDPNAGPKTATEWFRTAAFSLPAAYSFGTASRNSVMGPGLVNLDLSLQKEWALYESSKLEFRIDAFNSLNHPNFNLPGRIFGASNFGVITSALDPRELQIALKILF